MKNIDEKVKNEIVNIQIKYLRENQPSELINYDSLKGYLSKAISEYFPNDLLNEFPDYDLLKDLETINTKNWKGEPMSYQSGNVVRLKNAIIIGLNLNFGHKITNKEFVELYKLAEDSKGKIRNYGEKTHKLLKEYLTRKELI